MVRFNEFRDRDPHEYREPNRRDRRRAAAAQRKRLKEAKAPAATVPGAGRKWLWLIAALVILGVAAAIFGPSR